MNARNEIRNLALEALRKKMSLSEKEATLREDDVGMDSAEIVQIFNIDFLCEVRKTVTTATVGNLIRQLKALATTQKRPILLIAQYITPSVAEVLADNGVNALDCAGNCNIRYENSNRLRFHLANKGETNVMKAEKTYPLFQEAGLKIIFFLLQDIDNISKTYRTIQAATGVSLGAIRNVFNILKERNFIIQNNGKRSLKNKRTLFNLWVENYNQVLKPKILLGKMRFRSNEQRMAWATLKLPEGMYWGGEGGAYKIDGYIEPGAFDIYTDAPSANLMKTGMVTHDENGDIRIYHKFWQWETENQIAPLILIYADLIGCGNNRCQEAAQRLLDNGLKDYK